MKAVVMTVLTVAVLLTVVPDIVRASTCSIMSYKKTTYSVGCGTWGWSRCTKYKSTGQSVSVSCSHGGWTSWSSYTRGSCSRSCGPGTRSVTDLRWCTNPKPSNGGSYCYGSYYRYRTEACNRQTCPRHGGWTSWSSYTRGSCSRSCGGGTRSLTDLRWCTNPKPYHGGSYCSGSHYRYRTEACNRQTCPRHGAWSTWSPSSYGSCSRTCGGGHRSVIDVRSCNNPAPLYGGKKCCGDGTRQRLQNCSTQACPLIYGAWSAWGHAVNGSCSVTCGNGTRNVSFTRVCTSPANSSNIGCDGLHYKVQTESCNLDPCPVDGGWSVYAVNNTLPCSVTCGNGTRVVEKTRQCNNPVPQNGGADCKGSTKKVVTRLCKSKPCA